MKISLKGLSDEPRGSAWPPSARVVRCPVSQATSKTCTYNCKQALRGDCAHYRDCLRKEEEGAGNGRSVCSESSRLHARNSGKDNGMQLRKEKLILETLS